MNYDKVAKEITEIFQGCISKVASRQIYNLTEEDFFATFKDISQGTGLTVEKVLEVLIVLKVARLKNLMHTSSKDLASLEDNVQDLINYSVYLVIWKRHEVAKP